MLRLLLLAMASLASCGLVGHTLLDEQGWQRRHKLQADLATLSERNAALERNVTALASEADALARRTDAQEHAVRDELGWVRGTHDLVIDFDVTE